MGESQGSLVTERQRLFLWVALGICLFLGVALTSCLVTYAVLDTGASQELRVQVQELRDVLAELAGTLDNASLDNDQAVQQLSSRADHNARAVQQLSCRADNASLDSGGSASELTSPDAVLLARLKKTSRAVKRLLCTAEDNARAVQQLSAKVDNQARTVAQVSSDVQRLQDQADVNTKARTDFRSQIAPLGEDVAKVSANLEDLKTILSARALSMSRAMSRTLSLPNCGHLGTPGLPSGLYSIDPQDGQPAFPAFCDMDTAGGPWLVFQRRKDGSVNFTRNWADYESGFGDLEKEFWLGLEKLHRLTSGGLSQLRVDMATWEGRTGYALYSTFQVASSSDHFRLEVHGYSGNAGDEMDNSTARRRANGMQFSTYDQEHDHWTLASCAQHFKAGWWYNGCHSAHPNGVYGSQGSEGGLFVTWPSFYNNTWKSLKFIEMKIK